jgi:hypothetical protein
MRNYFLVLVISLVFSSTLAGPTLGEPKNVVVETTGRDESPHDTHRCEFSLTARQARAFLRRAVIITPFEEHDNFNWSPCFVSGTATFRGHAATWTIRELGTGRITFYEAFTYHIADPRARTEQE